jgi:hypothetical protein
MSHICKVEMSHFPVKQAGLECGRGIDHHERTRAELDLSRFSTAPSARLSHLPFEGDRVFPALC